MAGFIGGLLTGLFCGGVGVYLTWLSGRDHRKNASQFAEANKTIERLEEEKRKWQSLERFMPRIALAGTPPHDQFITVTDSDEFRVTDMDYLSADGRTISSQPVDRTGKGVQIPIDEAKVSDVQRQGCDPKDGSFSMSFRIQIEVNGITKPFILPVRVAVNSAVRLESTPLGLPLGKDAGTR